jgi:hypothetical protein
VACYVNRLHKFPDRISNLYFNYALLTRAIAKLGPYLSESGGYTFCTGDPSEDAATRAKVLAVAEQASSVPQIFDENLMFTNGEGPSLKEDFRNRFRNVSRLMDCVGCDKCRLWGKVQTAGYGTALKVLFEFDNGSADIPVLKRTELVALFNSYARLASSLDSIQKFRAMVEGDDVAEEQRPEKPKLAALPDWATKPRHVVVPEAEKRGSTECATDGEGDSEGQCRFGGDEEESVGETFKRELDKVIRAYKLVLASWVNFPINV